MRLNDLVRYLAVIALLIILLFVLLGDQSIRLWDESRLAINAWEMHINKQFLVTYFAGQPDMWNTKPPLMIWMQVASIRLFGLSEFSIRFPAALAALMTCLSIIIFCHRYLKNFWAGTLAAIILLSMSGYNGNHVARTGDYDALLILFLTLSALCIYLFSQERKPRYIFLFFLFTGLAVWTKGVAGLLFLPGLGIYLLLTGSLLPFISNRTFLGSSGLLILMIAGIYWSRETLNPGYLSAVMDNELTGRYLKVNEAHSGSIFYYVGILFKNYWLYFIPLAYFPLRLSRSDKYFKLARFLVIVSLTFLVLISISKTKLEWYAAPLFPLFAMLLSLGLITFLKEATKRYFADSAKSRAFQIFAIAILCVAPVITIIGNNFFPKIGQAEKQATEMSYFLRDSQREGLDLSGTLFLRDQYQPNNDFYMITSELGGMGISFGDKHGLAAGTRVIYWEDKIDEYLKTNYKYKYIETSNEPQEYDYVRQMKILSKN